MTRLPEALRAAIVRRGFDLIDCPYSPIQPGSEEIPIVRAIRDAEAEAGLSYHLSRPVTP